MPGSISSLKLNLLFLSAVLFTGAVQTAFCVTNEQDDVRFVQPRNADALMKSVVSQLPAESITIQGEMVVRKRRGVVVQKLKFDLLSNWGSNPSRATYIISDAFGKSLESMTLIRVAGKKASVEYAKGSPLTVAVPPAMSCNIQQSDVTWLDLTFSFLWWKGGKILDVEKVKGRECYIVEIPAPKISGGSSPKKKGAEFYSKVVLWIDKELHVLMQAEGYSSDDELMRKLWVRSFKKIDGRWMVKDLEIQQFPDIHRTRLKVREVKEN